MLTCMGIGEQKDTLSASENYKYLTTVLSNTLIHTSKKI